MKSLQWLKTHRLLAKDENRITLILPFFITCTLRYKENHKLHGYFERKESFESMTHAAGSIYPGHQSHKQALSGSLVHSDQLWRFRVLLQEWGWHFDISYTTILAIKFQFSEKCQIRSLGNIHSKVLRNSEENNQDVTQREMGNVREPSKAEKWLKVNDTGKNTVNQSTEQSQNCWGVPDSGPEPQCAYRQIWAPHFPIWKMKLTLMSY